MQVASEGFVLFVLLSFCRDEFNRLTELLQSRVVDSYKGSEDKTAQVNTLKAATAPITNINTSTSTSADVNNLVRTTE